MSQFRAGWSDWYGFLHTHVPPQPTTGRGQPGKERGEGGKDTHTPHPTQQGEGQEKGRERTEKTQGEKREQNGHEGKGTEQRRTEKRNGWLTGHLVVHRL
eukprot:Sspe_Gene.92426::Locus_64676_Transcript_3_9_Confidence_0.158_Length_331::g.92426::m.92426